MSQINQSIISLKILIDRIYSKILFCTVSLAEFGIRVGVTLKAIEHAMMIANKSSTKVTEDGYEVFITGQKVPRKKRWMQDDFVTGV